MHHRRLQEAARRKAAAFPDRAALIPEGETSVPDPSCGLRQCGMLRPPAKREKDGVPSPVSPAVDVETGGGDPQSLQLLRFSTLYEYEQLLDMPRPELGITLRLAVGWTCSPADRKLPISG